MSTDIVRLHQPNLTCSFDVTMTDDDNLWVVVMKNKDDIGILDKQFIETVWDFTNHFTANLYKNKMFKISEDGVIPPAHAFITHDKRFVTWTIIVQAVEKPLSLSEVMVNIGELTKQLAKQAGVNLTTKGFETRSVDANP